MRRAFAATVVTLAATLLLAACAQQPHRHEPAQAQRPAREKIQIYSLAGRVSVKRGNDARQAGILWTHDADRDDIELSGPLGQKAARLSRDAIGARLVTASHENVTAANWGGLAERVLGVALPLDNMTHWVVAHVSADEIVARDALGRPQAALADGWQLDYREYESEAASALPTLIEFRRNDIAVRLKIDQWDQVE